VIPLAHIGGIPVEEWLPFVVPVLAIYLYVRRRERRRRAQVERLVAAGKRLDGELTQRILERLREAKHDQLGAKHVPLLYPPGPDGATTAEIANRVELDAALVDARLEDLIEFGYLERVEEQGGDGRVWLTAEGFAVAHVAEEVVLASFSAEAEPAADKPRVGPTRVA
jgi:hypothetical protein